LKFEKISGREKIYLSFNYILRLLSKKILPVSAAAAAIEGKTMPSVHTF